MRHSVRAHGLVRDGIVTAWSDAERTRIASEAASLTDEALAAVIRKFRTEIGGLYELIADHLETHDPRLQ